MQQVTQVHKECSAPPKSVEELIEAMNVQVMTETRYALVCALKLREAGLPWSHLLPLIHAGMPMLADALGPVVSVQRATVGKRPRWSPPAGAAVSWYDTLAALDLSAQLLPMQTRAALNHRRQAGPPATVHWVKGAGDPGLAGLL